MGRFINADGFLTTEQGLLSNNMFAYCLNNPISRTDYYGTTSVDIFNNELDPTDDDKEYGTGRTSNGNSRGTVGKGAAETEKEHLPNPARSCTQAAFGGILDSLIFVCSLFWISLLFILKKCSFRLFLREGNWGEMLAQTKGSFIKGGCHFRRK